MNVSQATVAAKLAQGSERADDPAVRAWAQNFVRILSQLINENAPPTTVGEEESLPTFINGGVYVLRPLGAATLVKSPYDANFQVGQWTAVELGTKGKVTLIDSLKTTTANVAVPYHAPQNELVFACYRQVLGKFELMVVGNIY